MNLPRWFRAYANGFLCRICDSRPGVSCRCGRWARWSARGRAYRAWVGTRAGWTA